MNTEPASQAVVDRIAQLARQADSFELIRLAQALAILRGGGRGGPPRGPWRQGIVWQGGLGGPAGPPGPGGPPAGPEPGSRES